MLLTMWFSQNNVVSLALAVLVLTVGIASGLRLWSGQDWQSIRRCYSHVVGLPSLDVDIDAHVFEFSLQGTFGRLCRSSQGHSRMHIVTKPKAHTHIQSCVVDIVNVMTLSLTMTLSNLCC